MLGGEQRVLLSKAEHRASGGPGTGGGGGLLCCSTLASLGSGVP